MTFLDSTLRWRILGELLNTFSTICNDKHLRADTVTNDIAHVLVATKTFSIIHVLRFYRILTFICSNNQRISLTVPYIGFILFRYKEKQHQKQIIAIRHLPLHPQNFFSYPNGNFTLDKSDFQITNSGNR